MATRLGFLGLCLTLAGLSVIPLAAQQSVSVRVMTEPAGVRYTVDGTLYIQPTSFLWPVGSKHAVTIVSPTLGGSPASANGCETGVDGSLLQYDPSCRIRYAFASWEASGGALASPSNISQVITAD